ncbi:MAG TPA: hypothetical protein VHB79_22600 [Polyangiaceae bacterium]|nr:hypothetical protein [Polyangiaceae bacterium]
MAAVNAQAASLVGWLALGALLSACGGSSDDAGKGASGGNGTSGEAPTWHRDIAPLVTQRCTGCHQDGGISPFSLETYEQAKMWSPTFDAVLRTGIMPPFLARDTDDCKPRLGYKDDLRLSPEQVELFKRWNDAGCPEGDPETAAELPAPPELQLKNAEVSVTIPGPVTVDGPGDKFVCFSLAPDLTPLAATGPEAALLGDRVLIDGIQVTPGNKTIVHHVLVYADADGQSATLAGDKGYYDCFGGPKLDSPQLIMAWAPGSTPVVAPEGVAMAIPSKGRLVLQVHYHPTKTGQMDEATSLQLRGYGAGIPAYVAASTLMGNAKAQKADGMGLQPDPDDTGKPSFVIPAGATNHSESMLFKMPATLTESRIWIVGTHMHYVGTNMRIAVKRSSPVGDEPADECLLDTPKWDFNWQRGYAFDVPIEQAPAVRAGDIVELRCDYDNSMNNPYVQKALAEQGLQEPRDVPLGEETLDEMCLGVFGIAQKVSDLIK